MGTVVIDSILLLINLSLRFWTKESELRQKLGEFQHLIQTASRLSDTEARRRQVNELLNPLQSLLFQVREDHDKAKSVHLNLAAAYAVIGEKQAYLEHLNRACDHVVVLMLSTWITERKTAYSQERDQLLELLGEQRKQRID